MGLSKHAQEEVDERIKTLLLAFCAGAQYGEEPDWPASNFCSWLREKHPDLYDYVEDNKLRVWLQEK